MTVLVSDSFTDVDGTSLDVHVPDVRPGSALWLELFTNWTITSGQARTNTGYRDHAVIETGQADCQVSVNAATYWGDPGSLFGAGLVVRWVNQDNHWRVCINQADDAVYIVERNGAVDTQRASGSVTIDLGTEYSVKAVLAGQTITAYVNGVNLTNYASAALGETSTKHGLYICRTSNDGSHCDNFLAETVDSGAITLVAADLHSAARLDAPAVTAEVTLASADLRSTARMDAPAVTAEVTLAAARLRSASRLDGAQTSGEVTLAPADLRSAARLDGAQVTTEVTLAAARLRSASRLDGASMAPTTWTIPIATGLVDGASGYYADVAPGDILELEPGTRGYLHIINLPGDGTRKITIQNGNGIVSFETSWAGIYVENSHHFQITGAAHGQTYGIRFTHCGVFGILGNHAVNNCEFDHLRFDRIDILPPPDGDTSICIHILNLVGGGLDTTNYVTENIHIHDCLADGGLGLNQFGMFCYVGFSNRLEQPSLSIPSRNIEIDHNIIRNTLHKALQVGSIDDGSLDIHDNTLTRCAMSASQKTAIIVNHGAGGRISRNWIADTPGCGITSFSDGILIDDNLIIRCGDGGSFGYGIICSSHDYVTNLLGAVSIINNTIVQPNNYGVATNSTIDGPVHIHNNLIVDPVTGYYTVPGGANYFFSHNFTNTDVAPAGFADAANDNYQLAPGSVCINAGMDASAYGITYDGTGIVTRPQGIAWDQGCYEYASQAVLAAARLRSASRLDAVLVAAIVTLAVADLRVGPRLDTVDTQPGGATARRRKGYLLPF